MKLIQSLLFYVLLFLSAIVHAEQININTATAEQIAAAMNGVGERKAKAIVDYREVHGKFQSIDALENVDGIGEKTVEINRDKLEL